MKSVEAEIRIFIEEYFKAYFAERDFSKVTPFLSQDISLIGTGLHEISVTAEESFHLYKEDFKEVPKPIKFFNLDINLNIIDTNFCLAFGNFAMKGESNGINFTIDPLRYSMTIVKENAQWKLLHLHISTPNNLQDDNEVYPLQKLVSQNVLLNQKVEERTKKLVEANKRLTESNSTKEKLFSIIAHDIKSPFNTLLGFVNALQNQYDEFDAEDHKKFIGYINDSANKIYTLADNLLIWSKLQQNMFEINLTPLNLNKIVRKSSDLFNETIRNKNINFLNKTDHSIFVMSDEFMLDTILRNLISNAIKYTDTNGFITIGAVNSKVNGEITVFVEDTGIGIPSDRIDTLFNSEVNVSTEGTDYEKGTGLGLYLCKEFINLHGTRIWAESELGKGSKICFTLKKL